jgi:hypothetical protein
MANTTPIEVDVELHTPTESEVTIANDTFRVTVRSSAPFGEVVSQAQALYENNRPPQTRPSTVGFAGPQFEKGPYQAPPPSSTLAYPVGPV